MSKDIFEVFHIETKEDKYTFALCEFLCDKEFLKKASSEFGFVEDSNIIIMRESIQLKTISDNNRTKITPDLILYSDNRIAVIESKMYSDEGFAQTIDYEKSEDIIKEHINSQAGEKDRKEIVFYYFTLSGSDSKSKKFTSLSWADFYNNTLSEIEFNDITRECLKHAILNQTKKYIDFRDHILNYKYTDLFNDDTYWIRPYSILSNGSLDSQWNLNGFDIYNGTITGNGHSEFRTDFKKSTWFKTGNSDYDNWHFFIRIEWLSNSVNIFLNWESFSLEQIIKEKRIVADYIATSKLQPVEVKDNAVNNKYNYIDAFDKRKHHPLINQCSKSKRMLHMVKSTFDCNDKTIGNIIVEVSEIFKEMEAEINDMIERTTLENGLLKLCY